MTIIGPMKSCLPSIIALGATLTGVVLLAPNTKAIRPSLVDVQRVARAIGFFAYECAEREFFGQAAQCRKSVLSKRSLSEDEVGALVLGRAGDSSWDDCVCVMRELTSAAAYVMPVPNEVIGDLFFFGDLNMIAAIKSRLASQSRLE